MGEDAIKNKEFLSDKLPKELFSEIEGFIGDMTELRIREERNVLAYLPCGELVLNYIPKKGEVRGIVQRLAEHSLFSFEEELKNGFFTVGNGIRIGIGARFTSENRSVSAVSAFTSLNIRLARQYKGIASPVLKYLKRDGRFLSTLIVSSPGAGKTTLIRELVRCISNGEGILPENCAVIDERMELMPEGMERGVRTDLLSLCPKEKGIMMALRSLSPGVIAFDEIGTSAELYCAAQAAIGGVRILTSCHAPGMKELRGKFFFKRMLESGIAFERIVFLSEALGKGTLESVCDSSGRELYCGRCRLSGKTA